MSNFLSAVNLLSPESKKWQKWASKKCKAIVQANNCNDNQKKKRKKKS